MISKKKLKYVVIFNNLINFEQHRKTIRDITKSNDCKFDCKCGKTDMEHRYFTCQLCKMYNGELDVNNNRL